MGHIITTFVPVLFFVALGCLLGRLIYLLVFLPYRTKIACWYMKKYNSNYQTAKNVFDELTRKQEKLKKQNKTLQECYAEFYQYMEKDSRFRGSNTLYIEAILQDEYSFVDVEMFVFFQGKGILFHKIFVSFNFSDGIHLVSIELLYNEERGKDSFVYSLERKKFPPDESGSSEKSPKDDPVLELEH